MDKEIIEKELRFSFSRSAGSGGQHVNKVSTKVDLYFHVHDSKGLNQTEKEKVWERLNNRMNIDGILRLSESGTRSQLKNRQLVTKKFFKLLDTAFIPKKVRKKRKPTAEQRETRLKNKKLNSEKKKYRGKVKLL